MRERVALGKLVRKHQRPVDKNAEIVLRAGGQASQRMRAAGRLAAEEVERAVLRDSPAQPLVQGILAHWKHAPARRHHRKKPALDREKGEK